jgi:hypothetical protein
MKKKWLNLKGGILERNIWQKKHYNEHHEKLLSPNNLLKQHLHC